MSIHHGKDGVVKVGGTAIASVDSWSLGLKAATADKTAMGDTWESHTVGMLSGDGKVSCWLDPSDASQEALTIGAAVALTLYEQGTTTGLHYWSFNATVTGVDESGNTTVNSKREFAFKINGAASRLTA
jgi:subtilase family serine protease